MEKSVRGSVDPDQPLNFTALFTCACGLGLYWASFFTMVMRNSFMDGGITLLWYHLLLRVILFTGSALACVAFARKTDAVSGERGRRVLKAGVYTFSIVAALSSITAHALGAALPLLFDVFAWGLAGIGLACLLMLWIDLLAAFETRFSSLALAFSAAVGSAIYLAMNLLPFPLNIVFLALCPPASLGVLTVVERDAGTVPAAFVPLAESRERARLAPSFKGISLAYGVVFGLGIGSTTQLDGTLALYSAVACAVLAGAGAAWMLFARFPELAREASSFRLLFPVLIVALIPMSFLQGLAYTACNLLIVCCYVLFEIVGINFALTVAREHRASRIHLVATSQACLYGGLALGHVLGFAATLSGVMDFTMLSACALGLVVLLAIFVTVAPVVPLARKGDGKAAGSSGAAGGEEAGEAGSEAGDGTPARGRWKTRCEAVARDAGLSARETEVFFLLAKGRGIEHIQNKLCISSHTVKTHVYNIYRKMGINSREELLDAVETFEVEEK